jgi:hypothetical protein
VDIARAHLRRQARGARDVLAPFSPSGLHGLRAEVGALARTHPDLASAVTGSDGARLAVAAARHGGDTIEAFVRVAIRRHPLALARVALARAVIALREARAVDEYLAAAAIVDLDQPSSALLEGAVLAAAEAVRV